MSASEPRPPPVRPLARVARAISWPLSLLWALAVLAARVVALVLRTLRYRATRTRAPRRACAGWGMP